MLLVLTNPRQVTEGLAWALSWNKGDPPEVICCDLRGEGIEAGSVQAMNTLTVGPKHLFLTALRAACNEFGISDITSHVIRDRSPAKAIVRHAIDTGATGVAAIADARGNSSSLAFKLCNHLLRLAPCTTLVLDPAGMILVFASLLLAGPLGLGTLAQYRIGQMRPNGFALSKTLTAEIVDVLGTYPEIDYVSGFRPANDSSQFDVVIILSTDMPVPQSLVDSLTLLVNAVRGPETRLNISTIRRLEIAEAAEASTSATAGFLSQ